MAFSANEAGRFVRAMREERVSVEEVVERANVNEAQAAEEADLARIRAQIDESVGKDGFHAALQHKLFCGAVSHRRARARRLQEWFALSSSCTAPLAFSSASSKRGRRRSRTITRTAVGRG